MDELSRREWEAWRALCAELEKAGAVTNADLNTPTTAEVKTQGQRVLNAIREWGDRVSNMASREMSDQFRGDR